jgi:predicted nucleic acid-binding protein
MSNKAETARINGAKSNGPVTEEGKTISSQNSLKHGLTSSRVVLPHESQEEFDSLEASIVNRFRPYDEIEHILVHEMASALWRLKRIEDMEIALFRKAYKQQQELLGPEASPDDIRFAAYAEVAESKGLRMLTRHQAQLRRAYEKAWKEIEVIQEQRLQHFAQEAKARAQNEPKPRTKPGVVEQFIHALKPRSFSEQPPMAAVAGRNACPPGLQL